MSSSSCKISAGSTAPDVSFSTVGGDTIDLARKQGWCLVIVYRGKHCPLCSKYLDTLNRLHPQFEVAGIRVIAVSGDPREKAEAQASEQQLNFPVGYGLTIEQMHQLGLYVSEPRSLQETDRAFPEPGTFLINPDGKLQVIDVSNAPFARPDLASLLQGIQFIQANDYPIRGTMT